jgi:endonuclease YncB( thermonuclease family)
MGLLGSATWWSTNTQTSQTYELVGKVVRVADGDTLTLRQATNESIRLASIDSPEKSSGSDRPGQPYAQVARQFLADQVAGQNVKLVCYETDRYGRHICDVPLKDGGSLTTVNQALVLAGMAWANQQAGGKYLRDKSLLLLQAQAKAAKRGVWAEPNPTPPWVWRVECWRNGKCNK